MTKSCVSETSAWRLKNGNEDWGTVWMTNQELNSMYKWSPKRKLWVNIKDPRKTVRAL